MHDTVIVLNDEHVLLVESRRLRNQLSILDLVIVEPSTESFNVLYALWHLFEASTEQEDSLLINVRIGRNWFIVEGKPRVGLETHQAYLTKSFDQEHDVAVSLFCPFKKLLLNHLRVIDEAYKLPLAKIDHSLWDIQRHVNHCDFLVLWVDCLVGEQRVVHDPSLRYWLLWII